MRPITSSSGGTGWQDDQMPPLFQCILLVAFLLYFCALCVLTHTFEIMVVSCVVGCTGRCVNSSFSFHRIPKEEKRSDVNIAKRPC